MIEKILKDIKGLFKVQDKAKFLKQNIPYLAFFYVGNIFSHHIRAYTGGDVIDKIFQGILELNTMSFIPSIHLTDILIGIGVAALIKFIVYSKGKNAKKFRQGKEYGSARWGTRKDIEPYMDEKFQNNILLTQTERLTMNGRPANPKYARNKNVLVIGGSGSGKTRFYVKPNLMQMHSSYCVTDPKGTIVLECGKMLEDNGYEIKILNTINFKKSMKYNPFAYIRSEKDILKLVQTIIANTKGEGEKAGEDFWVKAEKLYYTALIGYIWYEAPREEKNFATLLDMIDASEVREDDETYMNPIDRLFEVLEKREPTHFAVKQYKKYKLAAGYLALYFLWREVFDMLNENIKIGRKSKGLSQDELAIKLNVVRQTVSKWERGLSVPDSEMLISLSEILEIPVSELLGENIELPKADELEAISQKLEVVNIQLAQKKGATRKFFDGLMIALCVGLILIFFVVLGIDGSYLNWDYKNPELAAAGVLIHGFEWIFIRIFPIALIALIVGIFVTRRKK